ncbi:class I SAM-dependent methyltransferase [Caballeronia sp. SBC2]|uniref:class I SAM-dependent methyltransferase n=1 Tax=Caballeronia sp. SBC2 TaxID=2705547 RepID=UPI0013E18160|nr:class I SAM-dependent methyltransferase [Caballeronia sp. SBC2]QIE24592.1 Methyltransferase domain protein [Caballeronia sp. SBC2]
MNWTAGYNTSVAYANSYHHEQSPTFLNACLVMQRVSPPSIDKFTYCELGFGQGLTALILAATHPNGDFYACDFNPLHVLAAVSVRDEARLPNLTLLENDFGELAQGKVELPQFDYITMHGILSWISDETRAQIVQFLRRYLKPGGGRSGRLQRDDRLRSSNAASTLADVGGQTRGRDVDEGVGACQDASGYRRVAFSA